MSSHVRSEPSTRDWAFDFDHTTDAYAEHAFDIWDDLRDRCPVARTERFGGAWLPTRHQDVVAVAQDPTRFSSRGIIVSDFRPLMPAPVGFAPPITSDPPFHEIARRMLLPAFAPKAVELLEPMTRAYCARLASALASSGRDAVDAAEEYAQHIPVRVIAHLLGVPESDGDRLRTFIHRILERPGQPVVVSSTEDSMIHYVAEVIADHRAHPRADLISYLLGLEIEGSPLPDEMVMGVVGLLLIAGIDTTWSAIGSSLWHLAQHPDDRRRLVDEPEVVPFAIEELLRAYAPVTMARLVSRDTELGGRAVSEGDWVLLPFPAANRHPGAFEDADRVILDRQRNRHLAFGVGIHRCLGSNLARMELRVAIEEWLRAFPEFELHDSSPVRWSTGQVRGPRTLPVRIARGGAS